MSVLTRAWAAVVLLAKTLAVTAAVMAIVYVLGYMTGSPYVHIPGLPP